MSDAGSVPTAAVLISGGGSNLQSLIDASLAARIGLDIRVVISNVADAGGLQRARRAGIATQVIENGRYAKRSEFDCALAAVVDRFAPDMLLLAGFMRILTADFVRRYAGRILNIHPSLLPEYPGLDTHQRALDDGESRHGCTVHFVTEELDGGPAIIQGMVPVERTDTAAILAARVLQVEHRIYPIAADLVAAGRVCCIDGRVKLDGEWLPQPIAFDPADWPPN